MRALEGMRELGRDDIPESTDEARAKWPIVLGPHKIRHSVATYWWGLRGPNGPVRLHRHGVEERTCGQHIARRATGDVDDTLKAHYVMCQSVMLEAARHLSSTSIIPAHTIARWTARGGSARRSTGRALARQVVPAAGEAGRRSSRNSRDSERHEPLRVRRRREEYAAERGEPDRPREATPRRRPRGP